MSKKFWIFLIVIILGAVAGGFFVWLQFWQPEKPDLSIGQPEEAPTLFSKEDYKVVEREDGKYIIVEKVGLTCKVPEGWKIEFEGSDIPKPEYWVNLYSPDAEVKDIPIKGCGISIIVETAKKNVEDIKENIELIQGNPDIKPEEISYIYKDYIFEVIKIDNHQALKWFSPDKPVVGQGAGIDIPIGEDKLISFSTRFPAGYKEKCSPVWEEFLENIVIE